MWDQAGPVIRALVARVDSEGIPDITDPWPVKDVSLSACSPAPTV
jgi:hypothetical protein